MYTALEEKAKQKTRSDAGQTKSKERKIRKRKWQVPGTRVKSKRVGVYKCGFLEKKMDRWGEEKPGKYRIKE